MAVTRQQKEEILKKANAIFKDSKSAVLVHFSGINGNDVKDMRNDLHLKGVKYTVIKKTLIEKAALDSDVEGEFPKLDGGELALAYSLDEETAPAQGIKDWSKKLGDKLEIVGGVFENKFQNKIQMTEIANIPSLEVLRGMFVNILNSPIQRTAIALDQIAQKKA